MTIYLRPKGRGRWREIVWSLDSQHLPPFTVFPGDIIPVGGLRLRVTRVVA